LKISSDAIFSEKKAPAGTLHNIAQGGGVYIYIIYISIYIYINCISWVLLCPYRHNLSGPVRNSDCVVFQALGSL
jgi:hypothetical protein